jgi:site-specific DNA-cytosine methylase
MFEQLEYLRHHQPALGVFEQVPNFRQMHGGVYMREFAEALEALGYVVSHKILEARHFDSCQHHERLFVVAARGDAHRAVDVLVTFVPPMGAIRCLLLACGMRCDRLCLYARF